MGMKKKEKKSTKKDLQEEQNLSDAQETRSNKGHNKKIADVLNGETETDVDKEQVETELNKQKIEALQNKLDEANDKFLRLFSEFDNYRKRVAKERIELTKTASESIITSLLPVLDDLERAAEMSGSNSSAEADQKGIILIYNKFKTILRQKGVEEIGAVGEDFNTDFHDAITHVPANNQQQKGKVIEEIQKGYILNGKVIRYARVIVAN